MPRTYPSRPLDLHRLRVASRKPRAAPAPLLTLHDSGTMPPLSKWAVPWPGQFELSGPAVDQAVRVRLHDITPAHLG